MRRSARAARDARLAAGDRSAGRSDSRQRIGQTASDGRVVPGQRRRDHRCRGALRNTTDEHIVFVVPPGSRIATGRLNFKLLTREAASRGLAMAIASPDAQVRALASLSRRAGAAHRQRGRGSARSVATPHPRRTRPGPAPVPEGDEGSVTPTQSRTPVGARIPLAWTAPGHDGRRRHGRGRLRGRRLAADPADRGDHPGTAHSRRGTDAADHHGPDLGQ